MINRTISTCISLIEICCVQPEPNKNFVIIAIVALGCLISNILLIIHFYKFFKYYSVQRIATKNLTCYCICVFLTNVHHIIHILKFTDVSEFSAAFFIFAYVYLRISASTFSLIMTFDTCVCFRNTAVYLRPIHYSISKRSKTKFTWYCFLGAGVPLLITVSIFLVRVFNFTSLCEKASSFVWWILTVIHIFCLLLFFLSLRYIRMASIDKNILC